MITAISLTPTDQQSWTLRDADKMPQVLNTAMIMATQFSRDYQRATNIMDFVKYDHGVGSLETRLRNLTWCDDMEVKHYSGVKRAFIIGILTITEED